MTFAMYYLIGMLKSMGWPRKLGLPFLKKQVVDAFAIRMVIQQMAELATVLGAKRPGIAIRLITDVFRSRDRTQTPAVELWALLDGTKTVASHPEISPGQAIARFFGDSSGKDYGAILATAPSQHFVPWSFVSGEAVSFGSHMPFAMALAWGIGHPEEALAAYDAYRKKYTERLPEMLAAGLKLDPPYTCPTSDEVCQPIEELIASFEHEVRTLDAVPDDLLALPQVAKRTNG